VWGSVDIAAQSAPYERLRARSVCSIWLRALVLACVIHLHVAPDRASFEATILTWNPAGSDWVSRWAARPTNHDPADGPAARPPRRHAAQGPDRGVQADNLADHGIDLGHLVLGQEPGELLRKLVVRERIGEQVLVEQNPLLTVLAELLVEAGSSRLLRVVAPAHTSGGE